MNKKLPPRIITVLKHIDKLESKLIIEFYHTGEGGINKIKRVVGKLRRSIVSPFMYRK